jgi:hypothetical protein
MTISCQATQCPSYDMNQEKKCQCLTLSPEQTFHATASKSQNIHLRVIRYVSISKRHCLLKRLFVPKNLQICFTNFPSKIILSRFSYNCKGINICKTLYLILLFLFSNVTWCCTYTITIFQYGPSCYTSGCFRVTNVEKRQDNSCLR